jgi:hypothetical protein
MPAITVEGVDGSASNFLANVFDVSTITNKKETAENWCTEDIEHERERPLSRAVDYDIECAEQYLNKLKEERDQFHGE